MTTIRTGLVALALTAAIAGCATAPTVSTTPGASPATPTVTAATTAATPTASGTTTSPAASGTTTSPAASGTPAAPANVDTAAEKAAWEALMSPDGEYAAYAAYSAVIDKYGQVEPYVTIRSAEQRHIDALVRQLSRTDVTVPANPYLGVIPAPASLKEAALAWAEGERDNVALYDRLLRAVTTDSRLTKVLGNLRAASQDSHLPLFVAAAAKGGTLTAEEMRAMHP